MLTFSLVCTIEQHVTLFRKNTHNILNFLSKPLQLGSCYMAILYRMFITFGIHVL